MSMYVDTVQETNFTSITIPILKTKNLEIQEVHLPKVI